jgi:Ser/Thr protein kinase RdoA (MazF antagonist)
MPGLVNTLLDLYPAQYRPTGPITPLGNSGGGSGATLWRYASGQGLLGIRAWPVDGPSLTALTHIHRWLDRLADLGFVPIPILSRDGRTIVDFEGRFCELTRWMPGSSDLARPPASSRLRSAFSGLAAVHQRLSAPRSGRSPALQARLDEAESLLVMELGLMDFAVGKSPDDPIGELSRRWLSVARDGLVSLLPKLRRSVGVEFRLQPVVRDARPEHFLFEGDRLVGLVDFGAMGVDSLAIDLARLLSEWVGTDRAAQTIALDAYTSINPLSPHEVESIDLFAESAAWLGPARWIRWHFVERRPFDDPDAVRRGLDRSLSRLFERIAPIRSSAP